MQSHMAGGSLQKYLTDISSATHDIQIRLNTWILDRIS